MFLILSRICLIQILKLLQLYFSLEIKLGIKTSTFYKTSSGQCGILEIHCKHFHIDDPRCSLISMWFLFEEIQHLTLCEWEFFFSKSKITIFSWTSKIDNSYCDYCYLVCMHYFCLCQTFTFSKTWIKIYTNNGHVTT